ncbi:YciI family protein [Echinicola jeungdonensis]|uniref:YciI family protein n=1 Tax=Echinicola jeungdonensis TaxID=709343 RepID=A0ABV5JA66_9BACT|nr:YciI family protein [Echinicola jeungdonensis]MDN3669398.1 YciI family protein [Echinicola jeungdonensis]
MNEYLLIIRGGEDLAATMSPEEMQSHMQDWQKWMGGLAENGKFVGGQPLMNEGKSLVEKGRKVIDRPLAEGKEMVGGYIILKANSLVEATELAKGCPGFQHDCTLEVREIRPMG